jgi:hypothetical protein
LPGTMSSKTSIGRNNKDRFALSLCFSLFLSLSPRLSLFLFFLLSLFLSRSLSRPLSRSLSFPFSRYHCGVLPTFLYSLWLSSLSFILCCLPIFWVCGLFRVFSCLLASLSCILFYLLVSAACFSFVCSLSLASASLACFLFHLTQSSVSFAGARR